MDPRYLVTNVDEIPSPSMLVYRERLKENIDRTLEIAGGPERLRPHIKTHKMRAVIEMQRAAGIDKFKCATIYEARMLAEMGVEDVFIAYQMIGPNIGRLVDLAGRYPGTTFRSMVDDAGAAQALSAAAAGAGVAIDVLLDFDVGQHRTGIAAGPEALELYALIDRLPGITPGGCTAMTAITTRWTSKNAGRPAAPHWTRCGRSRPGWSPGVCPCRGASWAVPYPSRAMPRPKTWSPRPEPRYSGTGGTAVTSPTCPSKPRPCSSAASSAFPRRRA